MDPSAVGTGSQVLNKIQSMVELLRGRSPLPKGCTSGGCSIGGGKGEIDYSNRFLLIKYALPNSGPADLPLVLTYKSDNTLSHEHGYGWFAPYTRHLESSVSVSLVGIPNPMRDCIYTGVGPTYVTTNYYNKLVGTEATGWTETQPDGDAYTYDTNGVLRTRRNKAGLRWTLSWDGGFTQVRGIVGPFGRRTTIAYDGAGKVRRFQDPGGRITTLAVNANSDLVRITSPELCVTSFVYDATHRMKARIDPLGNRTTYIYDDAGSATPRLVSAVVLPQGQRTTYAYISPGTSGFRTVITSPRGARWTLTAADNSITNPLGRVSTPTSSPTQGNIGSATWFKDGRGIRTTFTYTTLSYAAKAMRSIRRGAPGGGPYGISHQIIYTFTYDGNDRLSRVTDELGKIATLLWDGQGNRVGIIDPYLGRTTYVYNGNAQMIAVVNPLGARSTQVFDSQSRRIADIDPLGNRTTYAYNANNQLLRVTNALGNITTTLRDEMNRLTVSIDPLGNRTSFSYDLNGHVTRVVNPLGKRTTQLYNANGWQTAQIDPLGNRTSYAYDANGNAVRVTNPLGKHTTSVYDLADGVVAQVDALENRTSFSYDASGNMRRQTNALGNHTTRIYDLLNRPVSTVDPLGNRTTVGYDDLSNAIRVTNALGKHTTSVYDALQRPVAGIDTLGNRTSYSYDAVGRRRRITNALGRHTTSVYDRASRVVARVDPLSNRKSMAYDVAGRQLRVTDALGKHSTSVYDQANRLIAKVNALGYRTSYAYDAASNRVLVRDANDHVATTVYNSAGWVQATVDEMGYRTSYAYDPAGRQTALIDSNGNRTSHAFNAVNRLVSTTDPLGALTSYAYDAAGRATLRVDSRGLRTSCAYDASGRQTSRHYSDGTRVTMVYDALSRRVALADTTGRTSSTFDAAGRLLVVANSTGIRLTYSHDALGARVWMTSPEAAGARTSYAYDAVGRLTWLANPQGQRTSYTYDSVGRPTRTLLANGTRASSSYDAAGQLTRLANLGAGGSTTLSSFAYTYDPSGYRTRVAEVDGSLVSWSYDRTHQLTREWRSGTDAYAATYTYDGAGNRKSMKSGGVTTTYTYGMANQLKRSWAAIGITSFGYDAAGNLVTVRPQMGAPATFSWDVENRLSQVSQPSVITNQYLYNGDSQRVRKVDSRGTTIFVWDSQHLLLETDTLNTIQAAYTLNPRDHGGLLSQRRGLITSYYHFDGQDSTRQLTDSAGMTTDTYLYDAWGKPLAGAGTTSNSFRYRGRSGYYYDSDLEAYQQRARYYDPVSGRFLSRDPIEHHTRSNPYGYASNSPLRQAIPSSYHGRLAPQQANQLPETPSVHIACCSYTRITWGWSGLCFWRGSRSVYSVVERHDRLCSPKESINACCDNQAPKGSISTGPATGRCRGGPVLDSCDQAFIDWINSQNFGADSTAISCFDLCAKCLEEGRLDLAGYESCRIFCKEFHQAPTNIWDLINFNYSILYNLH